MALFCIISEIKRKIGQKLRFFIPHLHSTPAPLGEFPSEYCHNVLARENENGGSSRWWRNL